MALESACLPSKTGFESGDQICTKSNLSQTQFAFNGQCRHFGRRWNKIILAVAVGMFFISCDKNNQRSHAELIQKTKLNCAWDNVLAQIRTPSTARMITYRTEDFDDVDATIYTFTFDVQNDFGAMIRANGFALVYLDSSSNNYISDRRFAFVSTKNDPGEQEFVLGFWRKDLPPLQWKGKAKPLHANSSVNSTGSATTSSTQDVRTNSFGMRFCRCPSGSFLMGAPNEEGRLSTGDKPQHKVTLTKEFWMGEFPITQAQYSAIIGINPSHCTNSGPNAPVENITWDDTQKFISIINSKDSIHKYRLPTEAEWEYACRAGTTGATYGPLDAIAWYRGNSELSTHPVGGKQPNAWGLYDMLGNVCQFCQDWYGKYPPDHQTDPRGPSSSPDSFRVIRGSAISSDEDWVRSAYRNGTSHDYAIQNTGFRLVMEPASGNAN